MAKRKAKHIDWRRQFSLLDQYMDGAGGVVTVRYKGEDCAVNAFLETLTATFETRGDLRTLSKAEGLSIRLDPDNYKVRYLLGIRGEFERKLGMKLAPIKSVSLAFEAPILSHNTAGGDQHIEAFLNVDADPFMAAARHDWVSMLCEALRNHLKTRRFMLILSWGSSDEQSEFWSSMWGRVSELVEEGLLLIRFIDENAVEAERVLDSCICDCDVRLVTTLTDSAVQHAIEDVAKMICELVPGCGEAESLNVAKGYVLSRKDSVRELHDGLMGLACSLREFG